ncbi:hypothetical protein pb186bvf_004549 [Paramecium bursaria]
MQFNFINQQKLIFQNKQSKFLMNDSISSKDSSDSESDNIMNKRLSKIRQSRSWFWRNWKIKNQVLAVFIILSLLVLFILAGLCLINFQLVKQYQLESSKILMARQITSQTTQQMNLYTKSAKNLIFRSSQHVYKTDALFQFIQKTNTTQIQQPFDCLNNFTDIDKYVYSYTFCYGFFSPVKEITKYDQQGLNLSATLTMVLPMMDMELDLLFSLSGDQEFFSIWPGDPFSNYHPHKRVWYTDHVSEVNSGNRNATLFSPPYIIWTWHQYMITQTRTMHFLNGSLGGVAGSDINFTLFTVLKQQQENNIIQIIDSIGTLMLSPYNLTEATLITNTSLTGISEEDFRQIINLSQNKSFNSTCQMFNQIKQKNFLCIMNKLTNDEQLIYVNHLYQPDLMIVLQVDPLRDENLIDKQLRRTEKELDSLFWLYAIIDIISLIIAILIPIFIIYRIMIPVDNMLQFTRQSIFREVNLLEHKLFNNVQLNQHHKLKRDTLDKLSKAYDKMLNFNLIVRRRKNLTCKYFEKLEYPQQYNKQEMIPYLIDIVNFYQNINQFQHLDDIPYKGDPMLLSSYCVQNSERSR